MSVSDPTVGRALRRLHKRLADDAPCAGARHRILCPFCDRPMTLRRSVLGRLDELSDGSRPHIEGLELKCAGDDGCAFRADFDIPLTEYQWEAELALRDGDRVYDVGYEPDDGDAVAERLRALGYLPDHDHS